MPANSAKVFEDDNSGILLKPAEGSKILPDKRVMYLTHHGQQLDLSGAALGELTWQFIRNLGIGIKELNERISASMNGEITLADLFTHVRDESFRATTIALCGEHILTLNPTLPTDFWEFDSWLASLLKKIPRWIVPKAYRIRDKNHENIMRWHKYAHEHVDCRDEKLKDVLWEPVWGSKAMRKRAEMFGRVEEIAKEGHAAADLGMIWGYELFAFILPVVFV
jgi:hypothetical protein